MAKKRNDSESQATERPIAPVTDAEKTATAAIAAEPRIVIPTQPRQKRVERQGAGSVPYTAYYPQVRAGVCEYCGILDPNVPSQYQYKLCQHYRGMDLRCSYCPDSKDPSEVNRTLLLNVHGSPSNPDELVVVCSSLECSANHIKRFQMTRQ